MLENARANSLKLMKLNNSVSIFYFSSNVKLFGNPIDVADVDFRITVIAF